MRRRNLLAGLLLLPLGATAGLFWWLQKDKPRINPAALVKANIAFWKSDAGREMKHYPYFGVRIYNSLPTVEPAKEDTVTVLPASMTNSVGNRRYGNVVGYDFSDPKYAEKLYHDLMKMVPQVRIINIQERNPWLDTYWFKQFVLVSSCTYLMAYGVFYMNYPRVELHDTVASYCRDLQDYLTEDLLTVPETGECINKDGQQYIQNQVIPALTKVFTYIREHAVEIHSLMNK